MMRDFLSEYGSILIIIIGVILFCVAAVKYLPGLVERFTIANQAHHASIE